jgi:chromosomal replication initiation ATPase DnaA
MSVSVVQCNSAEDVRILARVTTRKREATRIVNVIDRGPKKIFVPIVVAEPEIEIQTDAAAVVGPVVPPPKICDVQKEICRVFHVSMEELISRSRLYKICIPRQIGMAICRALAKKSYPSIGLRFGGMDHTTVLHAYRKFKWLTDKIPSELKLEADLSVWVERAFELALERHELAMYLRIVR